MSNIIIMLLWIIHCNLKYRLSLMAYNLSMYSALWTFQLIGRKQSGLWSSHVDDEYQKTFGHKPPWSFAEMGSLYSDIVSVQRYLTVKKLLTNWCWLSSQWTSLATFNAGSGYTLQGQWMLQDHTVCCRKDDKFHKGLTRCCIDATRIHNSLDG